MSTQVVVGRTYGLAGRVDELRYIAETTEMVMRMLPCRATS